MSDRKSGKRDQFLQLLGARRPRSPAETSSLHRRANSKLSEHTLTVASSATPVPSRVVSPKKTTTSIAVPTSSTNHKRTKKPPPKLQLGDASNNKQADLLAAKLKSTPVDVERKRQEELVRLPTGGGVDVSAADKDGLQSLITAAVAVRGCEAVTRQLIDQGACVAAAGMDGQTPLICAARFGNEDVARCSSRRALASWLPTPMGWARCTTR